MNIINITDNQRKELCNELAKLTFEISKDKNLECIYFAPYKGLGAVKGNILEVTVVGPTESDISQRLEELNKLYQDSNSIRKFGVKLIIDLDDLSKYRNESGRNNNLLNSTILYDRDNEFAQIKKQTCEYFKDKYIKGTYYYDNLAEIYPPLEEILENALDKERMKRDTIAVKEFTKSKLFLNSKNI